MTREPHERDFSSSDDEGRPRAAAKASQETLARRKIIKPRSRVQGANGTNGSGFNFGATVAPSMQTNAFASVAPPVAANPFGGFGLAASTSTAAGPAPASALDTNAKIKALNEKFVDTIVRANTAATVADFSAAAQKYIDYYRQIHSSGGNKNASAAPAAPKATANSSSESSDEEVKVEGPKFTLTAKPTVKNSPFLFGPKPAKKAASDSDSESEVEIKGPTFEFSKPIVDKVFKVAPQPKPASTSQSQSMPADLSKPSDSAASTKPFSFASSHNSDKPVDKSAKPAFTFNQPKEFSEAPKPAFDFGKPRASSAEKLEKLAFNVGSSAKAEPADKPVFTFGRTAEITTAQAEKPQKPFAFGQTEKPEKSAEKSTEKPAEKPAFAFGQPAVKPTEKPTEKPAFSFGQRSEKSAEKTTEKPAFSFGQSAEKPAEKPAFSFGQPSEKPAEKLTEKPAEKPTEKPAFSFGQPSEKPAFSFGQPSAPAFSFGQTKADAPTGQGLPFSFGLAKPEPAASLTSDPKPSFSFGSATPAFGFGSSAPAFNFGKPAETSEPQGDAEGADAADEEEPNVDFKPVAQLASEKIDNAPTGEEDEETLYTKRTKLMLFDPSQKEQPYVNKGLGDVKVLRNRITQKSRIVIRAEGGLRVLLNTAVNKDVRYDTLGNGSMVRVPTVKEDKTIETFVLKVKTPADGAELLQALTGAQ
jgi:nucleoporin NUP2